MLWPEVFAAIVDVTAATLLILASLLPLNIYFTGFYLIFIFFPIFHLVFADSSREGGA